jgi:hypothetical protein
LQNETVTSRIASCRRPDIMAGDDGGWGSPMAEAASRTSLADRRPPPDAGVFDMPTAGECVRECGTLWRLCAYNQWDLKENAR